MKDYLLTLNNLPEFVRNIQDELEKDNVLIVSSQPNKIGKWTMARLWRSWMNSSADWMAQRGSRMPLLVSRNGKSYGSRDFNKNDAHDLFCSQWLNVDAEGIRLSWAKDNHSGMRTATKGERYHALNLHEQWALDKGILLLNPRTSEYQTLKNQENK